MHCACAESNSDKGEPQGRDRLYSQRILWQACCPLLNGYAAAVSREPAGSLKEVIYRLKKVQETIGAVSAMTKADFKELMIDEGKRVKSHE